jgi:hypothetical protein
VFRLLLRLLLKAALNLKKAMSQTSIGSMLRLVLATERLTEVEIADRGAGDVPAEVAAGAIVVVMVDVAAGAADTVVMAVATVAAAEVATKFIPRSIERCHSEALRISA